MTFLESLVPTIWLTRACEGWSWRKKAGGKKGLSMGSEGEWRRNEPWAEVKSKVEAHLLRSDDSKVNGAQMGNLLGLESVNEGWR